MTENRIIWAGVAVFAVWFLCVSIIFSAGIASDALFLIGIPALITAAPLLRWHISIESGKKSKIAGLIFLLLLQFNTFIFSLLALWAYSDRNSGWLNFWPESQLAQASGYMLMVLPAVTFVIFILFVSTIFVNKRRSS